MKKQLALILIPVALLVGCGADSSATPTPTQSSTTSTQSVQANDDDVMFAQMMIVHHAQALEMAELASTRATTPEVVELAATIQAAQQPEIDLMKSWLANWGASETSEHAGHMTGLLSQEQMTELADASGTDFDKLFLTGMIAHHEGAVAMASDELTNGTDPNAVNLAMEIVNAQSTEIEYMKTLLGKLS